MKMVRSHGVVAALAVVQAALFSTACGSDECLPGESRCDGNAILSCGTPQFNGNRGFTALSAGCGADLCLDLVVENQRTAVCSATGELDPRCPAEGSINTCADDHTLLSCQFGFGSDERTCDPRCVADPGDETSIAITFCAAEAQPNPICGADGQELCDGDDAVSCLRGWVTERRPCSGASPICAVNSSPVWEPVAYCTSTTSCAGPEEAHCNGNLIEGCIGGHVVSTSCDEGMECERYGPLSGRSDAVCAAECEAAQDFVCVDS